MDVWGRRAPGVLQKKKKKNEKKRKKKKKKQKDAGTC